MTAERDSSPSDESRQVSGALPTEGTSVICWTTGGGWGGLPQTNNPTGVVGRASPCSQSRLVPEADHQCDKLTGIPAALWEANEDFLQSGGRGGSSFSVLYCEGHVRSCQAREKGVPTLNEGRCRGWLSLWLGLGHPALITP